VSVDVFVGVPVPYGACIEFAPMLMEAVRAHPDRWSDEAIQTALAFDRIWRRQVVEEVAAPLSSEKVTEWHSAQTVANRLGISKQAVTKRCHLKTIRAVKDDRNRWRISPEELERLEGAGAAS
jgi:excisionase family DNA binding protein